MKADQCNIVETKKNGQAHIVVLAALRPQMRSTNPSLGMAELDRPLFIVLTRLLYIADGSSDR